MTQALKDGFGAFRQKLDGFYSAPVMKKAKDFVLSGKYPIFLFILSSIFVVTGKEVFGTMLMAAIVTFSIGLSNSMLPLFEGILLTTCFTIRCKLSYDAFYSLWWMAIPIVIFLILYLLRYPPRFKKGPLFGGILATSVAVTLGGLGSISAKEYFSPTSLFYVFLLGFGMLIVYMFFCSEIVIENEAEFANRFSKMMCIVILFLCVCLAEEYISRYAEFAANPGILAFQWRNNGSTILMLAMPFPLYLSAKKFPYFFLSILAYLAILCTGSRGGMIFGFVELVICFAVILALDKHNRIKIAIVAAIGIACGIVLLPYLINMLSYTLGRLLAPGENRIRLTLISRGLKDFLSNPAFGKGIGYMGNNDIHNNAKFTLCWYHCSPVQIIGSMGSVGVVAYIYLFSRRIKTFAKNLTFFGVIIFISYIGLELMSLVNPGIFSPFPYLVIATLYFVIIEKCSGEESRRSLKDVMNGTYWRGY